MTAAEQYFHTSSIKTAASSNIGSVDSSSALNSPSVRLNVADVSAQFNLEYYNTMSRQPDHLHGFYGKQSQMVHSLEGDLEAPICTSLEAIHSRILAMGYQGTRIIVESIDAQASLNGGIFILTTGNMKLKDGSIKKFVQSFFLAEQPNGYYVLNDCFRFIEQSPQASIAPTTPSVPTQQPVPKSSEEVKPEPVKESLKEVPTPVQAPIATSPVKEKKPEMAKPDVKTVKKEEVKSSVPNSWASLAAGHTEMWKDGVVAASKGPVVSVAADTPKDTSNRRDKSTRSYTSKNANERRDYRSSPPIRDSNPRSPRTDKPTQDFNRSVFVRNFGSDTDSSALRKVLETAGVITQFDFNSVKGQAFVEYETNQMALTAINGKYQFNGVTISIEARRPASQRPNYRERALRQDKQ